MAQDGKETNQKRQVPSQAQPDGQEGSQGSLEHVDSQGQKASLGSENAEGVGGACVA